LLIFDKKYMKVCKLCKELKELKEFTKNPKCADGHLITCKKCIKIKNKDKPWINQKACYQDKTKYYNTLEYKKAASLRFRERNFEQNMLLAIKSSAKKRGLEFDLTIEDIIVPEYCPYLNIKLTKIIGSGKIRTNPSVDRIDNSKGYIKGNIMVISDLANRMKLNTSINELLLFAKNVLRMHENKV